jgi:glycine/D-amino acid oxidase-like deaminating enzyme
MAKHFDVVVLGSGVGALAAAALLARRAWRVLVLGQGHAPATYFYDGVRLARRPFTFLAASSPAWTRIVVELAQSQTFRRRLSPLSPMFQVLGPRLRLDVPPDTALFGLEVEREFSDVRRIVDELYVNLADVNAAADAAFEKDVVVPPGGFWERRETERVVGALPLLRSGESDLLAELAKDHRYRAVVDATVRFASHLSDPPPFARARLHGAWTRGVLSLARGEDELTDFLRERCIAHGGEVRLQEQATSLSHRRGKLLGVKIDGDDVVTGAQFLVSDLDSRQILSLAPDYEMSRRAEEEMGDLLPRFHRYTVSIAVRSAGLPALLAAESFLVPSVAGRPVVHLQRLPGAPDATGVELLVAEALLPAGGPIPLETARAAVLASLEEFLPFVERHYLLVDSPHDGLPLWDFRSGKRVLVDRVMLRSGAGPTQPEPMRPQWEVAPSTFFGLGGEPLRAPISGVFVVGPSALPALGQEGELLAAWSAARVITRTDSRKEKMRREMWSKVELG